ncbi:MAG: phosphatase PAP2 family protein [Proteobacteria bacterium]|nr:phosphatase PAP2 family protein [Pseudomonadota bacterium]
MTFTRPLRALAAIMSFGHVALAQAPASHPEPVVTAREATIFAAGLAATAALLSSDVRIAAFTQDPAHRNGAAGSVLTGARLFGDPGSIVLGAGLWAGGRLAGDKNVETDGLRALEAVAASGAVTFVVKGIVGRGRPYASPGDAGNTSFGRGFRDDAYTSFPSGHTTAAFAFASAITARVAARSPSRARWLGPLLYGAAALTGYSRLYDNKHWASDVLAGATIGTVSGLLVVRHLDHTP